MATVHDFQVRVETRKDLLERGISSRAIQARVARGELVRICHGAYLPAENWQTLLPSERHLARVVGHSKVNSARHVYSHHSAALVHGMALLKVPTDIHISGQNVSTAKLPGRKFHRNGSLLPVDVGGLAVTEPLQTVVQCVSLMALDEVLVLADSAVRLAGEAELRHVLATMTGRGCAVGRTAARLLSGKSESAGESLTRLFLHRQGYPKPQEQLEILAYGKMMRADFAWPELGLILEFDGQMKYRMGPSREATFGAQNEREAILRGLGWDVVRTTWDEVVGNPARLKQKLDQAFARAHRRSRLT